MSKSISDKVVRNVSENERFSSILERHLSRRTVLRGGLGAAAVVMSGAGLTACGSSDDAPAAAPSPAPKVALGFESIPLSAATMADACVVPAGYVAQVLGAWGTPLNDHANAWKADGTNSSDDLLHSTGMHHDGMHYFQLDGSANEGLLVVNHEYIDEGALHPNGPTGMGTGVRPAEEVRKEINAHGVAVMHIKRTGARWDIVKNSRYNRRFTSATPMVFAGPLAKSALVQTVWSKDGSQVRGTNNNCGNGYTPWGTYLTCEENWAACFVNKGTRPLHQTRVGVQSSRGRYQWEAAANDASERDGEFKRWDVTPTGASAQDDYRNEVNGFGYIVEIDPYEPGSQATKRTALGRFAHEGCAWGKLEAGKPISFYSGDDSRFEYVYKFVSEAKWDPADANRTDRLAVGAKYMDKGTLYVAKFLADGTGVWLPLTTDGRNADGSRTLGQEFGALDAIILHTRSAADFVGATPMDRPEWTAVHPQHGDVYLTLTNNSNRTADNVNAANPRASNVNGHIIRWHDDADKDTFKWDVFVYGAPSTGGADLNRSGLTDLNQFASPDGLSFDSRGILWIQTDNGLDNGRGNDVAKKINDQMLAIVPAALSEGNSATPAVVGANQADLRRFFVGPNEAEVTGIAYSPDNTAIFLNIQHPGNWPYSDDATLATPTGTQLRPRSSTVVIQRKDGGPIGV